MKTREIQTKGNYKCVQKMDPENRAFDKATREEEVNTLRISGVGWGGDMETKEI